MKHSTCVIFPERHVWRVGTVESGEAKLTTLDISPESGVEAAVAAITGLLRGRVSAVMALASDACLAANVSLDGLPRKDRHDAMLYRLEEWLPLSAEDVVADFVRRPDGALGVCTERAPLVDAVEAFEKRGIAIVAVVPAALLAFETRQNATPCDTFLWQSNGAADVFVLENGRPKEWYAVPADARDVQLVLRFREEGSRSATVYDPALGASLERSLGFEVRQEYPDAWYAAATLVGDAVARGKLAPPVDLLPRSSSAGASPLRSALGLLAASVMVAALVLTAAFLWRARGYQTLADGADAQRRELFQRLFPGEPVPAGIRSRMAALADSVARDGGGDTLGRRAAASLLAASLAQLPKDVRFRVSEIDVTLQRISIQGEVASHQDAVAIAVALRRSGSLEVEEPQTRQSGAESIAFTIIAHLSPGTVTGRATAKAEAR
jgi:hypothetical protein